MFERQKFLIRQALEQSDDVSTLLTACREQNMPLIVAGGAITSVFSNQPINDLDFFFQSETDFGLARQALGLAGMAPAFVSNAAVSYKEKGTRFQLISKIYGTPEQIIKRFDFTISMAALEVTDEEQEFVMHPYFLEHLAGRLLVFDRDAQYPIASLWRAVKFVKRGYHLPAMEILKMVLRCRELQLSTYNDVADQLDGVDAIYLKELTDSLRAQGGELMDEQELLGIVQGSLQEKLHADQI